ncbi:MAG TPA: NRDE family protein [Ferruginibacter sp.]|nr:NRDE family protein [Ferruginibacter sp.]
MCTVVFIPDNKKVFFASLRDEDPERARALTPDISITDPISFLSPKDPLAGGTWIGANSFGNIIILLNGGFENHQRANYYRKSRGIIVSELLAMESPVAAWKNIDMKDIEPFTLIIWNGKELVQLVWDGKEKHTIKLNATLPQLWSSATLYNAEARSQRKALFQQWINKHPAISKTAVLDFFKTFTHSTNGFIMNRDEKVKTLSYTTIEIDHHIAEMSYYDLLANTDRTRSIMLPGEMKIA